MTISQCLGCGRLAQSHFRTRRSGLAVVVILVTIWVGAVVAKTPEDFMCPQASQ